MDAVINRYDVDSKAEITMEANPGTLDLDKLTELKSMYFNRLSIGLQAWQNRLLKSIGRIHTAEEFERNFYDARAVGFDNINLDLMFSLPGQSLSDWRETLQKAVGLNPESYFGIQPDNRGRNSFLRICIKRYYKGNGRKP